MNTDRFGAGVARALETLGPIRACITINPHYCLPCGSRAYFILDGRGAYADEIVTAARDEKRRRRNKALQDATR